MIMIILDSQNVETERLSALKRYNIVDTPPHGSFNKMTSLASNLFDVPVSIITLVDHDRIWFKSSYGLELNQINKDEGLCATAILHDDIYVVEDASVDVRCMRNPLVAGEFGLKFYAAAPLTTKDGHNLGTFCIIDKKPRVINEREKIILQQMAEIVMDEIELQLSASDTVKKSINRIIELEKENNKLKARVLI